jgi:5-formyltetrahydrofolate cyclo-ligase
MKPDGRCGLRERHLSTGPYYSFGSWLCLDRGSVNSGTHLKTEVHEDLLVFTDCVVAVALSLSQNNIQLPHSETGCDLKGGRPRAIYVEITKYCRSKTLIEIFKETPIRFRKRTLMKSDARHKARQRRRALSTPNARQTLSAHLPDHIKSQIIAGFSPIGDEIDTWPLLKSLRADGHRIALPVVIGPEQPLTFREWRPGCEMETDRFGVAFPGNGPTLIPKLILVPLLAFTASGERLGYGGGYYDRTLQALRSAGEVFACGVAYAGQEVESLPTDAYDERLDGILTETGFKAFT